MSCRRTIARGTRERKACANRCANADVIAAEVRAAVDVERDVPAQHDEHARLRDAPNITLGHRGRRDQRDAEHLVLRRLARVEAEHSGWLLPVCFSPSSAQAPSPGVRRTT